MKLFIFLLALIAIVSSIDKKDIKYIPPNEISDIDYGCEIPQGSESCTFIKQDACCAPFRGKCKKYITLCMKRKIGYSLGKAQYHYKEKLRLTTKHSI